VLVRFLLMAPLHGDTAVHPTVSSSSSVNFFIIVPPSSSASTIVTARW
jgi:hypothetical protein